VERPPSDMLAKATSCFSKGKK